MFIEYASSKKKNKSLNSYYAHFSKNHDTDKILSDLFLSFYLGKWVKRSKSSPFKVYIFFKKLPFPCFYCEIFGTQKNTCMYVNHGAYY